MLELVKAYEKANGLRVKYKIVGRRAGDVDKLYCKPDKANKELGWKAVLDVENMCETSYKFENNVR